MLLPVNWFYQGKYYSMVKIHLLSDFLHNIIQVRKDSALKNIIFGLKRIIFADWTKKWNTECAKNIFPPVLHVLEDSLEIILFFSIKFLSNKKWKVCKRIEIAQCQKPHFLVSMSRAHCSQKDRAIYILRKDEISLQIDI